MVLNHEIRFAVTKEEKDLDKRLYDELGSAFKRTSFSRMIYLKGVNSLFLELTKAKKDDILLKLVKTTRKT